MTHLVFFIVVILNINFLGATPHEDLTELYHAHRTTASDINEHLPVLREMAKGCGSIIELGNRGNSSTWALLQGLCESTQQDKRYLEVEETNYSLEKKHLAKRIASECNISYEFVSGNIFGLKVEHDTDMLFIDSIHTYCHLTHELETLAPITKKYIVMHDTNYPWGYSDDTYYRGNYSEYPSWIDRSKKGLTEAVNDFLARNPGWKLRDRRMNNHGLTILERVKKVAMTANPDIHLFIHACTMANWKDVLHRQMKRVYDSGLYEAATSINIGVLGEESLDEFKQKYPKINQLFQNHDTSLYERPTLCALQEKCLQSSNHANILYFHTKGITRKNPNVTDWSMVMEYFLIDNWRDCLQALKTADVCGVNFQYMPCKHFSGNFWWANSNHICTLPKRIGAQYLDPEMWIGLGFPQMHSMHNSNVDHYFQPYPESCYK